MKLILNTRELYQIAPLQDLTSYELSLTQAVYQRNAVALEVIKQEVHKETLIRLIEHNHLMVVPSLLGLLVIVGFNGRRSLGLSFDRDLVSMERAMQSVYRQHVLRLLETHGYRLTEYHANRKNTVYKAGIPYLVFGNFRCYSASSLWKMASLHSTWITRMGGKIIVAQPNQKSFRNIKQRHRDLFIPVSCKIPIQRITQVPTTVDL